MAGTLGSEAAGLVSVGESGELLLTLLHDDEREGRDVVADDASTNRLALALTITAGAVASA